RARTADHPGADDPRRSRLPVRPAGTRCGLRRRRRAARAVQPAQPYRTGAQHRRHGRDLRCGGPARCPGARRRRPCATGTLHPPARHVPYASISAQAARQAITATSTSKAWNLPGMKCAQVILSNEEDRTRWAKQADEYEKSASTLGVVAAQAAYTEGEPWLQ